MQPHRALYRSDSDRPLLCWWNSGNVPLSGQDPVTHKLQ